MIRYHTIEKVKPVKFSEWLHTESPYLLAHHKSMKIFFFKKEEGENEWIVVFLACFLRAGKSFCALVYWCSIIQAPRKVFLYKV